MVTIVQKGDPVLSQKASEVPPEEITSKKIQDIITDMRTALAAEEDGVAIAAPQIGVPLRIFVVSGRAFVIEEEDPTEMPPDMVFINPEITKLSKETTPMDEGCLSVRYWYGRVPRAQKATVRAYDEHGKVFERGASGLMAQIYQHETDHLEGILFDSKASDLQNLPPENPSS